MFSAASVYLFVKTSEQVNTGWWNLGDRCIVQKSRPSSNLGVIVPLGARPPKFDVGLQRWKDHHQLSSFYRIFYGVNYILHNHCRPGYSSLDGYQ